MFSSSFHRGSNPIFSFYHVLFLITSRFPPTILFLSCSLPPSIAVPAHYSLSSPIYECMSLTHSFMSPCVWQLKQQAAARGAALTYVRPLITPVSFPFHHRNKTTLAGVTRERERERAGEGGRLAKKARFIDQEDMACLTGGNMHN